MNFPQPEKGKRCPEPDEQMIDAAIGAMDEAFKVTDPRWEELAKLPRDDEALKKLSREWWRVVLRAAVRAGASGGQAAPR